MIICHGILLECILPKLSNLILNKFERACQHVWGLSSFFFYMLLSANVSVAIVWRVCLLFAYSFSSSSSLLNHQLELLLFVKSIREIKFYEVVPIDHLLARLGQAGEAPSVCKRITQLLLTSFFPFTKVASEQVKRCLVLLETNTAAGTHMSDISAYGHSYAHIKHIVARTQAQVA